MTVLEYVRKSLFVKPTSKEYRIQNWPQVIKNISKINKLRQKENKVASRDIAGHHARSTQALHYLTFFDTLFSIKRNQTYVNRAICHDSIHSTTLSNGVISYSFRVDQHDISNMMLQLIWKNFHFKEAPCLFQGPMLIELEVHKDGLIQKFWRAHKCLVGSSKTASSHSLPWLNPTSILFDIHRPVFLKISFFKSVDHKTSINLKSTNLFTSNKHFHNTIFNTPHKLEQKHWIIIHDNSQNPLPLLFINLQQMSSLQIKFIKIPLTIPPSLRN